MLDHEERNVMRTPRTCSQPRSATGGAAAVAAQGGTVCWMMESVRAVAAGLEHLATYWGSDSVSREQCRVDRTCILNTGPSALHKGHASWTWGKPTAQQVRSFNLTRCTASDCQILHTARAWHTV